MPNDEPQPRRRVADRERRRWPDSALDQMSERVDDSAERLAAIDRRISELRGDLLQTRQETNARLDRLHQKITESFARNFSEHAEVQETAEQIAKNVTPSKLDWAVKFATIVSFLLVPILAAYVAAGS